MTQVGSGDYAAPEIDQIYVEYDLKIDVYSLGITFCTLAFFDMQIPNEEEIKSLGYSPELIEGIIRPMINKNPIERPTSQQINNIFMKYYLEKYVYNTGLYSSIVCLFSSPSLFNYFMNYNSGELFFFVDALVVEGSCSAVEHKGFWLRGGRKAVFIPW